MLNQCGRTAGPRPVALELPPTLIPNPIRGQAPVAHRGACLAGSGLIYGLFATCGLLLASGVKPPKVALCLPPVEDHVFELVPKSVERVGPRGGAHVQSGSAAVQAPTSLPAPASDPIDAPTTFPTGGGLQNTTPGSVGGVLGVPPDGPGDTGAESKGASKAPDVVEVPPSSLRVMHQEPLHYPTLARLAKVQGAVELLMTIDTQGRPTAVEVLAGAPQLQAEALRSARCWRFVPATLNGQPVSARFRLTINFRLA